MGSKTSEVNITEIVDCNDIITSACIDFIDEHGYKYFQSISKEQYDCAWNAKQDPYMFSTTHLTTSLKVESDNLSLENMERYFLCSTEEHEYVYFAVIVHNGFYLNDDNKIVMETTAKVKNHFKQKIERPIEVLAARFKRQEE